MKKLIKRFRSILSLVSAVALLIVSLPVTAVFAAESFDVGLVKDSERIEGYDYAYRLNDKNALGI